MWAFLPIPGVTVCDDTLHLIAGKITLLGWRRRRRKPCNGFGVRTTGEWERASAILESGCVGRGGKWVRLETRRGGEREHSVSDVEA